MPGGVIDYGYGAFTTTGSEVEIYTPLRKIWSYSVKPLSNTEDTEKYYLNETASASGCINVSGTSVTLARAVSRINDPVRLTAENLPISAATPYNHVAVPIGVAPFDGTITGLMVYNTTKAGGTPLINLGKAANTVTLVDDAGGDTTGWVVGEVVTQATSLARGVVLSATAATAKITLEVRVSAGKFTTAHTVTGATSGKKMLPQQGATVATADPDYFLTNAGTWGMPASGTSLYIGAESITVDAAGNGAFEWMKTDVSKGDVIIFSTTGGDVSNPVGTMVQVEITPAATTLESGTAFQYMLIGAY